MVIAHESAEILAKILLYFDGRRFCMRQRADGNSSQAGPHTLVVPRYCHRILPRLECAAGSGVSDGAGSYFRIAQLPVQTLSCVVSRAALGDEDMYCLFDWRTFIATINQR